MRASEIMTTPAITVRSDTKVSEIASLLLEKRISGVPVLDAGGKLVGIVTEGDLLGRPETGERNNRSWLHLFGGRSMAEADFLKHRGTRAEDVMTQPVVSVSPDIEAGEIARLLETRRIKRVPVVENGNVVGIVSRANLLHGLVALRGTVGFTPAGDDESIRAALRRLLEENDWLGDLRVNLVVKDGVVHVWGIVSSEEERRALHVAVEGVQGVRGVEDHLSPNIFPELGFREA